MADKIRLLPDAIANQIAAGEVIQRPASAVKELVENAVDAGATHIKVLVKNAGKTLIQIIDNGSGMSETDARMCFEKHATSKLKAVDDLFDIRTMGFRGEALASIAAIAQVELRTRLHDQQLGALIEIEGMKVTRQEPCQTLEGTSIAIKNLFYNVPARRNFLKSDTAELKNIMEEFTRISLAQPSVTFQLYSDDRELLHYKAGNLKQRICSVFDDKYAAQIVPLEEQTYALTVGGYVGKPEYAKKTRGEQYIYVNRRYIKSPYLHHAIASAFDQMIPRDAFPFYILYLDIDPKRIDINVHPQKYEIKFDDEKLVYTFVNLAVKHALGVYCVTPSIDFNQEDHLNRNNSFGQTPQWIIDVTDKGAKSPAINHQHTASTLERSNLRNWQSVFEKKESANISHEQGHLIAPDEDDKLLHKEVALPYQLHRRFILTPIKSGHILIDQQAAHERVLFERFIMQLAHNRHSSQRQLFPVTIHLSPDNSLVMQEMLEHINALGFEVQEFGSNTYIIHAFPSDIVSGDETLLIEELLEQYKRNQQLTKLNKRENLARSLAHSSSIKAGKTLSTEEMKNLIDELFACENPYTAPNGNFTFVSFANEEIEKRLENK